MLLPADEDANVIMLATGTGIAPFLSILQDFEAWQRFERIVLVYSVRQQRELAYQQLIEEFQLAVFAKVHSNFLHDPPTHGGKGVPAAAGEDGEGFPAQQLDGFRQVGIVELLPRPLQLVK